MLFVFGFGTGSAVHVCRASVHSLLEQALGALAHASPFELRKELKVVFEGEAGVDAGGVPGEMRPAGIPLRDLARAALTPLRPV